MKRVFVAEPTSLLARSQRVSFLKMQGCTAGLEGCVLAADRVGCEDEEPDVSTPTWRLHPLCASCAARLAK